MSTGAAGPSRRRLLASGAGIAGGAAVASLLPPSVHAALARPVRPGGGLGSIEHVVFLMQENRSFDHYFGTFPGARGFDDRTAIRLPDGQSVFEQPFAGNPDGYLLPYHISTIDSGAAAVPGLSHDWRDQHASWNQGSMDGWMDTHVAYDGTFKAPFTMSYYEEEDIPFHWALARSFTLADDYYCSMLGPTTPNRLLWEHGGIDHEGKAGGPVLETTGIKSLTFETGPETMHKAGINYKFYWNTDWVIPTTTAQFAQFNAPGRVPEDLYNSVMTKGTLFGDGTRGGIGDPANPTIASNPDLAFEEDCANGVLPDVSFIGSQHDENPPHLPALGAQFLATKLEALAANEDLWNSTVFVINYDENDGFFDHVVPPTPDPREYPEEFVHKISSGGTPGNGLPIGAGFRVPAFVVSPWSVGGRIFSKTSDHTSCLRLIEAVAAAGGLSGKGPVEFANLSGWRRKTFSDLTDALRRLDSPQPAPSNTEFESGTRAVNVAAQTDAATQPLPPRPGGTQHMPSQER